MPAFGHQEHSYKTKSMANICLRMYLMLPSKETFFLHGFSHQLATCDQTCLRSIMYTA